VSTDSNDTNFYRQTQQNIYRKVIAEDLVVQGGIRFGCGIGVAATRTFTKRSVISNKLAWAEPRDLA